MDVRWRSLAAWLLIAQSAVLVCLSFWALLLLTWVPDEDEAVRWDSSRAHLQAGAASAVLVVLAVVSAAAGVARLRGRTAGGGLLVAALLGGALAVLVYGLPGVAAVLAVAGCAWVGVLRRDDRLAHDRRESRGLVPATRGTRT
ncbi:hypothetical protein [Blastococcus sp. LR1]|uniref:hypothetical protein n=1 Tax=Blastococcus sp. LR1 TaxID=2877000 RepID=UPI001CCEDF4B|nr:hypothetical protein [Blastococcus sp. LR1]MCA0145896.1 hypothetical protein [Blastococcus sp. LR1]